MLLSIGYLLICCGLGTDAVFDTVLVVAFKQQCKNGQLGCLQLCSNYHYNICNMWKLAGYETVYLWKVTHPFAFFFAPKQMLMYLSN